VTATRIARRVLLGIAAALALLLAVAAGFIAAVQAGHFRGALLDLVSARVGRPIEVGGPLQAQLFTFSPRISAARLIIDNPPWMPAGRTAEIGKLSLVLDLPRPHHRFGVKSLTMESATLHLVREADGRANWQWTDPRRAHSGRRMAIVRSLSVPGARVTLDDERRHLKFEGTVSADAPAGLASSPQPAPPLRIRGEGDLNGRPAGFEITGDSLATATHETPYHFSYTERSSGSRLDATGSLPRPFDFGAIEATFQAAGEDLKDLYFLVGLRLIDTGRYRLSGKLERDGLQFKFEELSAHSGQSDMHGSVAIDSRHARSKLDIRLDSRLLRMADLGARAAGRAPPVSGPALVLSNATLSPGALRRDDAAILFRAERLEAGRLALSDVSAKAVLDQGVLTAAPLAARLLGGEIHGRVRLDVNQDPPLADVDLQIAGLQLAEIHRQEGAAPPPIEGLLQARIAVSGRGSSIHQVAATASGLVTVIVPGGTIRDSLAELTGMDLRGLGLLLTKSQRDTALRCAVAVLPDRGGTLTVQELIADTDPVLITGGGQIRLDTESLDLSLRGEPKSLRLFHWRSPISIKGTLSHPSVDIKAHKLQIVDPGKAKNADCPALIASAESEQSRRPASAGPSSP